jgi:hypothetical protein
MDNVHFSVINNGIPVLKVGLQQCVVYRSFASHEIRVSAVFHMYPALPTAAFGYMCRRSSVCVYKGNVDGCRNMRTTFSGGKAVTVR